MHRIDTATKETDKFGSGKHGFTEGDPTAGVPATATTEDFFDAVQEEIARAVEDDPTFTIALAKTDHGQLTKTLRLMRARLACNLTEVTMPGGGSWQCVYARPGTLSASSYHFLAGGTAGEIALSSSGFSWASVSPAASFAGVFYDGAADGSVWVLVGSAGEIQTAPLSGSPWTRRETGAGYNLQRVAHDGSGVFVAVGTVAEIRTSPDGTTWTHRTPDASYTGTLYGVAYGNGVWVICGNNGEIQTSTDSGATWTRRTTTGVESLRAAAYSAELGMWVVVGDGGATYVSTNDGVSWTRYLDGSGLRSDVAWSDRHGWIAASGGLEVSPDPRIGWDEEIGVADGRTASITAIALHPRTLVGSASAKVYKGLSL